MVDKIIACNWESGIFYMRNIDKDGLLVCSIQGEFFLKFTYYFKCSSEIL